MYINQRGGGNRFGLWAAAILCAGPAPAQEPDAVVAGSASTLDYPAFYDCFDGPIVGVAAGCTTSNYNLDGHVDLKDLAVFQRSYQTLLQTAIVPGATMLGEILPAGDTDIYTFFAPQGVFVTVDLFTQTTPSGYLDIFPRVDLLRPDASQAATVSACGSTRLDTVPVDASGTWSVRVRENPQWFNCGYGALEPLRTGQYTLTVCLSNTTSNPIPYGQTILGAFSSDCHVVNYTFAGSSGDVVTALFVGNASVRRMRMFDPSGSEIGVTGPGVTVAIVDEVLAANGTYRLSVEALNDSPIGTFGIGLSELDAAVPIAFNTPVNTTIGQPAEVDLYEFTAVSGSTVTVDYGTPTDGQGYPQHFARVELIRPDGTTAAGNAACGNFRLDSVAVNQTGLWTVRVRTHETWYNCGYGNLPALTTGNYTLRVCTSSPCPP